MTRRGWTGPSDNRQLYEIDDVTRHIRGGVGVTFRATLTAPRQGVDPGAPIGLKMLTGMDQARFEKLVTRSSQLSRLRHANLAHHIECFVGPPPSDSEVDEDDADLFFAAHEWVEGTTLESRVPDATPAEILSWGSDIASGLDALHLPANGGLAHRDISLRNIVVTPEGRAVLIDFDTVLWGDLQDSHILSTSGSWFRESRPGLAGAQAGDRTALAAVTLRALAEDVGGALTMDQCCLVARDRLARAGVADPNGIVDVLSTGVTHPDSSANALMTRAAAGLTQKPVRKQRTLVVSAAVGAAVVAIVAVTASHQSSPSVAQPIPQTPTTWAETTGGPAHTWTNYITAAGGNGPTVPGNRTVQITCRIQGFKVTDGDTWWYRIATTPWSNTFYVSADAFYNNGRTSGSLTGTPFYDPSVKLC